MNHRRLLLSLLAVGLAALTSTAQDKAAPTAHAPEWAELFGDASLPVVWQSAAVASEKIAAALASKRLEGIADWAETIHLASHALMDQVKIDDAEKSKRLRGVLAQAAKIADDVLDAAQHNEPDQANEDYRRLASALTLVKLRLPKAVVDAPPQDARFAKAGAHGHDEHGEHVPKK